MTLCKSCCKLEQSTVGTIQNCCVEEHVYDGNEGTCANKQRVLSRRGVVCCVVWGGCWFSTFDVLPMILDISGKIAKSFFLDEVLCVVWCGVAGSRRSTSYDS